MSLFLATCLLAAGPLVEASVLDRALDELRSHAAEAVPVLTPAQHTKLGRGEVVALYRSPGPSQPCGALGLVVLAQPRVELWLAARDDHGEAMADLTTHLIVRDHDDEVSYGHLRLPWPLEARRWQVRARDNRNLAAATGGRAWERHWDLEPGCAARVVVQRGEISGVSLEDYDRAVAVATNHGAWIAVELDSRHTLLGFSVSTQVGGFIPDELVAQYSVLRMDAILRGVEARAHQVHQHYVTGHALVRGGDGVVLPTYAPAGVPDVARR